jgi:DNA-binding response OmpR family regulator
MSKQRFIRKPIPKKRVILFIDAEEAWFWFIRSERARLDGARLSKDASNDTRPCDPDDLYRVVMALHRRKRLRDDHLKVLAHYGWRECPPDQRVREDEHALNLWREALDRLTTVLKAKGIVRHDDPVSIHG